MLKCFGGWKGHGFTVYQDSHLYRLKAVWGAIYCLLLALDILEHLQRQHTKQFCIENRNHTANQAAWFSGSIKTKNWLHYKNILPSIKTRNWLIHYNNILHRKPISQKCPDSFFSSMIKQRTAGYTVTIFCTVTIYPQLTWHPGLQHHENTGPVILQQHYAQYGIYNVHKFFVFLFSPVWFPPHTSYKANPGFLMHLGVACATQMLWVGSRRSILGLAINMLRKLCYAC